MVVVAGDIDVVIVVVLIVMVVVDQRKYQVAGDELYMLSLRRVWWQKCL